MSPRRPICRITFALIPLLVASLLAPAASHACGGFFCGGVPIVQNAEQIIFRQDGNQVAAIVRIQYSGPAEDFSWVVPVPGIPDVDTSSEMLFTNLERITRPSFRLEIEGDGCDSDIVNDLAGAFPVPQAGAPNQDGVTILEEKPVGPFNVRIVASDDPEAMANWLIENNYDLNDRGRELLAPYIEAGMNFVALRLQKDKDTGDLVPLRMVYNTSRPMVPIRLTAVAADPDLGLLVYLVGPAQAIPTNYPAVEINYARLNWFQSFSGYQQYQALVTAAMDEVGGHGFATDFADPANDVVASTPEVSVLEDAVNAAAAQLLPQQGIADLFRTGLPQTDLLNIATDVLPLPPDEPQSTYVDPLRLSFLFSGLQLASARSAMINAVRADIIMPYVEGLRALGDNAYLTRLYTTLSPEEMTLDPSFGYKSDLPPQLAQRRALYQRNCVLGELQWQIVLGEGTGRDGEVIASGFGRPDPFGPLPDVQANQTAALSSRMINENVDPMVVATGDTPFAVITPMETLCGILGFPMLLTGSLLLCGRSRRRRR